MRDAIILGGGISGLTAAYLLQRDGFDSLVLEKADGPGGPISSLRRDGYLHERGPNSLLLPDPWVEELVSELELGPHLLETDPAASKRFIVKNGRPVPVPSSPLQAATTSLFSLKGKLGFLSEPFRSPISEEPAASETVAAFVTRRMGKDFLDYAIDPFVSGVYAGDPHQLILEHAFPLMRSFERDGGSIIRGALAYNKKRRGEGAAYKKRSVSFDEGLGLLPTTLGRKLGDRLRLSASVTDIEFADGSWQVRWRRGEENFQAVARQLIVCLPSYTIKTLNWPEGIRNALDRAPDLSYPAVHSLAIGFKRSEVKHPLDGFGMLVPSKEPQTILGALFNSSLFPHRAPEGYVLLTAMLGGVRHPELADATEDELLDAALTDLRPLLGIKGEPSFTHVVSWPRAIPQYTSAFGNWRDTLHSLEKRHSGLFFGGSAIDGIAMGAALMSGKRQAERAATRSSGA